VHLLGQLLLGQLMVVNRLELLPAAGCSGCFRFFDSRSCSSLASCCCVAWAITAMLFALSLSPSFAKYSFSNSFK
jgi:hypothetical protein